jgi:Ulp1 family protease
MVKLKLSHKTKYLIIPVFEKNHWALSIVVDFHLENANVYYLDSLKVISNEIKSKLQYVVTKMKEFL